MSNTVTANKTAPSPLERKNTPALVLKNPENIEARDIMGFFEEPEGFDATGGSINNFNSQKTEFSPIKPLDTDKVLPPDVASEIFNNPGEWIVVKPKDVLNKTGEVVSNAVNFVGDVASASKDAGIDLFNQIIGKDQAESQTPVDPEKQAEENKKIVENQFINQKQEEVEVAILTIHRTLEALAQQKSVRENLSNLTGLQMWLESMLTETGETREDLKTPAEQKAEELAKIRAMVNSGPVTGASRQGGQGLDTNQQNNDLLSNETQATSQRNVG